MLVLERKLGERIVIGQEGEIVVEVVEVRRNGKIRLGVTADPSIPVHRAEVALAIASEQRLAEERFREAERLRAAQEAGVPAFRVQPDRAAAIRALIDAGRTLEEVGVSLGMEAEEVRAAVEGEGRP